MMVSEKLLKQINEQATMWNVGAEVKELCFLANYTTQQKLESEGPCIVE